MPNTKILALGHYLPPNIVTNEYLASTLQLPEEEIVKRTGIEQRRYVDSETSCSEIALHAVTNALQRSSLSQEEIDLIIFATLSPDHFFPGSGCFLQAKLKLPGVPALDIRNQCSGFLYGLVIADHFIRLGTYKRVLLVGAEIHSTGLNFSPKAKEISILFGDGAACAILAPSDDDSQIILSKLHADGRYARELWVEAPSSGGRVQIDHEDLDRGAHYPQMNGSLVFRHAVRFLSGIVEETLSEAGFKLEDVSLFVFHQANLRIIDAVVRRLRLSQDKILCNIQKYGNTTSASIPILLSEAEENGRLQRGNLVLLAAFGAGFSWGSTLLRY